MDRVRNSRLATRMSRRETGFETVLPVSSFEANLPKWARIRLRRCTRFPDAPQADGFEKMLPLRRYIRSYADGPPADEEVSGRDRADSESTDATLDAHRAAWKRIQPGLGEYQIAATMRTPTSIRAASGMPTRRSSDPVRMLRFCTTPKTAGAWTRVSFC